MDLIVTGPNGKESAYFDIEFSTQSTEVLSTSPSSSSEDLSTGSWSALIIVVALLCFIAGLLVMRCCSSSARNKRAEEKGRHAPLQMQSSSASVEPSMAESDTADNV